MGYEVFSCVVAEVEQAINDNFISAVTFTRKVQLNYTRGVFCFVMAEVAKSIGQLWRWPMSKRRPEHDAGLGNYLIDGLGKTMEANRGASIVM